MDTLTSHSHSLKILFAPDFSYANNILAQQWIFGVASSLISSGHSVTFAARDFNVDTFHDHLLELGADVVKPEVFGEESLDATGVLPRYRARQIIKLVKSVRADIVLAQGIELTRYLTGGKLLVHKLWSLFSDNPVYPAYLTPADVKYLDQVATGSKFVLAPNEVIRSQIESSSTRATSKTASFPPVPMRPLRETDKSSILGNQKTVLVDLGSYRYSPLPQLEGFASTLKSHRFPPRIILCGDAPSGSDVDVNIDNSGFRLFPGVGREEQSLLVRHDNVTSNTVVLIPKSLNRTEQKVLIEFALEISATPVFDTIENLQSIFTSDDPLKQAEVPDFHFDDISEFINALVPNYENFEILEKPVKVVLAGADFKFAGDILETLFQRTDIDLRVDLFEANAKPQPEISQQYLDWADVIIAEFASKNAIWYSQNVSKEQKLIVHLHGYELISDWIDQLNIDNVHSIIVASEFYRQKALNLKNWPAYKVRVISNSVKSIDLHRPKLADSRFHIGIVGIVPILKRPDRALDLLESLLQVDNRYYLHIRGHSPWNYAWEWKKAAHQDSYRYFYQRIKDNPLLREHIIFEPFSPDMGNWLKKIGWMLSTSTRETFHMAAIEAATSGAIPIAWEREGSREIIGNDFNVTDTHEAIQRILSTNKSVNDYLEYSDKARKYASRYASNVIGAQWIRLIHGAYKEILSEASSLNSLPQLHQDIINSVLTEMSFEGTEGGIAILDENIKITSRLTGGALKDLELFIRGAVALDSKRYSLFKPNEINKPLRRVSDSNMTVVTSQGAENPDLARLGFELEAIEVSPPDFISSYFGDSKIHSNHKYKITVNESLRFDRWCEVIKSDIVNRVDTDVVEHLLASGPWWHALPVALAADTLNIGFIWALNDTDDINLIQKFEESAYSTDAFMQLCYQVLLRADAIVAGSSLENIPLSVVEKSVDLFSHGDTMFRSRRSDSVPVELLKEPKNLRIGVVAPDSIADIIASCVAEIVRIPPEESFDSLSENLDSIIFFASADETGDWKNHLSYSQEQGNTLPAMIMDKGRQLGVRSIFVYDREGVIPLDYYAAARKADTLVTVDKNSLTDLLTLNPSSTTAALYLGNSTINKNSISRIFVSSGIYVKRMKKNSTGD